MNVFLNTDYSYWNFGGGGCFWSMCGGQYYSQERHIETAKAKTKSLLPASLWHAT